jgi:hypothetical protein
VDGAIGDELGDELTLVALVRDELIALRGERGQLRPQKFASYPALVRVCGGGDLLDAYLMFERELRRYKAAGRNEAAAAISISAPADTVLDRLEHAVGALPQDGRLRDQRTARRWSDDGIDAIAADLVYLARLQGRLGTELLSIEVHGNQQGGIQLTIDQMTSTELVARAPLIRAWQYVNDEPEEREILVDLEEHPAASATKGDHTMRRHRVAFDVPPPPESKDEAILLGVSVEGRDAPMRTVVIQDHSTLTAPYTLRFSVYRTIASVEILSESL